MRETGKRYIIYAWEQDEIESFSEDLGIDWSDAIESGRRDISDYGSFVDSTNDENEANSIAMKKLDSMRHGEVSIYDINEKHWFN